MDDKTRTETNDGCRLQRVNPTIAIVAAGVFNALIGAGFLLAGYVVIIVASSRGVLDQLNEVTSDLGSGSHYSTVGLCLLWTAIVIGWTVVLTVVAGIATLIFNRVLQALGGIDLELGASARRPAPSRQQVVARVRGWIAQAFETQDAPT